MLKNLLGSLLGRPKPVSDREGEGVKQAALLNRISPQSVEQLIEAAGRGAVFARARDLGWGSSTPPLWVWNQIAMEVIASNEKDKALTERVGATLN